MPSARAAEEKPSICTFSSVNYTDFFQGLLYFLHVTLSYFIITFQSFSLCLSTAKVLRVKSILYRTGKAFTLIINTEMQFSTYHITSSAVR